MDDSIPKEMEDEERVKRRKSANQVRKNTRVKDREQTQTLSIHLPYDHELPFVTCELCQM